MQEREISISDMLFCALRKWRKAIVFAIVCAILAGAVVAVMRVIDINDPEKVEKWQTEYEVKYGAYWAEINEFDRQIQANERLVAHTQSNIERLNRQKIEYEAQLEDLKAQLPLYEDRITSYEKSIASLEHELETLKYYLNYIEERNDKSLIMAINSYDVKVYEIYLRVDSGYEILPGNTYQDIDPTPELLQTYSLLVSNNEFFEKMISDLKLNTEVRYLTELISIGGYGVNSLRVRVISDQADWAKKVAEYISNAIEKAKGDVEKSIAEHDLQKYNTNEYSLVDTGVYSIQQNYKQEVLNYEASIRGVNTSILNTDASIRSVNAEIRALNQQIDELNLTLSDMPLELKALEDAIAGYNDANFGFRTEQLELLEEPEPKYEGYTTISVFTGFIKFAIIGGAVSAILAFAYFAIVGIMKGKALSSKSVSEVVNVEFFGFWPKTSKKKAFDFIDKWIDTVSGCVVKGMSPEVATELVLSNATVACAESKKVMLCGGADKAVIAEVAEAMKKQLTGVEVISGGTISVDPVVVRGVAECDAIILVEQLDKSGLDEAVKLKERAQAMNKPVLGVVVHN